MKTPQKMAILLGFMECKTHKGSTKMTIPKQFIPKQLAIPKYLVEASENMKVRQQS